MLVVAFPLLAISALITVDFPAFRMLMGMMTAYCLILSVDLSRQERERRAGESPRSFFDDRQRPALMAHMVVSSVTLAGMLALLALDGSAGGLDFTDFSTFLRLGLAVVVTGLVFLAGFQLGAIAWRRRQRAG